MTESRRQTDEALIESLDRRCQRIAAMDDALKVFVPGTFQPETLRRQAEALLDRFPDPAARPPLFGMTVGVKDIFHCHGFTTRCGSRLPTHLFQGPEAELVTRLKTNGALVMGKTATTEFAYFAPAPTVNPHNPAHTPGGSSSGSAAGVAAGFFDLALGTQTVGSIIRPAAYCGVTGFKPSLGRISTAGIVPFSRTVDHAGFFSGRISDMLPVLMAVDDRWHPAPAPEAIRLGVPEGPYLEQTDPDARAVFGTQLQHLADAGCTIVKIQALADIQEINARHSRLISGEIARVHAGWFDAHQDQYRSATRDIIASGITVSDGQLDDLRHSCADLRERVTARMIRHGIDAWASPATTGEAPLGLSATGSPLMNLPWTHAGLPTIAVPAATGPGGLPLGLQLTGGFMADEKLMSLAARIERMLTV